MRWLRKRYESFVKALASELVAQILGPVNQSILASAGVDNLGLHKTITSQPWYPVLVQAVNAAESHTKPGGDKHKAVVKVMHDWFANRNFNPPPAKILNLAIELALQGGMTWPR